MFSKIGVIAKNWVLFLVVALSAPAPLIAQTAAVGAAVAARPSLTGERLFLQCRACHSLTTAQSGKVGPALGGVFSRNVGSVAGYDYSQGLKSYGGVWSDVRLDAFLAGPNRTVAGTKMAFAGMPDATRRAALIAYLRANTTAAR